MRHRTIAGKLIHTVLAAGAVGALLAFAAPVASGATSGTLVVKENMKLKADHQRSISIEADNVTLDCAGHTVTGSGSGFGILLESQSGVTVNNCDVSGFEHGVALFDSSNNTIKDTRSHENNSFCTTSGI